MTDTHTAGFVYGAAYYPEHHPEDSWARDLDRMAEASMNLARVGEFAWRCLEPADGQYDFAWLDRFIELAGARGVRTMLCPPLRTAPAWLVDQDPSILTVDSSGTRQTFGSRYTFCINHPLLLDKGMRLAERLAARYGASPHVHSWHLDNEYGDENDCHCPRCRTAWHDWLRERYGTIGELNRRWGTVFWSLTFDAFEQVPTPMRTHAMHNPALWLNWRRFRSERTVSVMRRHADAIRPHIGGRPVTSNFQTLWNMRTDYYEAAQVLDVPGINYYCGFGAAYRSRELGLAVVRGTRQSNLWVLEAAAGPVHVPGHETPRPGDLKRVCLHMTGGGADGIVFFRWRANPFGAEQHIMSIADSGGTLRRGFEEVCAVGKCLKSLSPLLAGSTVRSEAAVLYDFPARWYLEGAYETPGTPWQGPRKLYLEQCTHVYDSLRQLAVDCDAVGVSSDLSRYRLLVVPLLPMVDDALVAYLARFVHGGGVLVWHPYSGIADDDACLHPNRLHPGLAELFGIDNTDFCAIPDGEPVGFRWDNRTFQGRLFMDTPALRGAEAIGHYTDAAWQGLPAITERRHGAGRAVLVGTFADVDFYRSFLAWSLQAAGIQPLLPDPVPASLAVSSRTTASGRRLLFLLNSGNEPASVRLRSPMLDILHGEGPFREVKVPPNDGRVLVTAEEGMA